ncbi:hypothetical protein ES703_38499 [subsurface metagenome]
MTKYTITYQRKVQVRQYEMLTIGLAQEFETSLTGHDEGFTYVRDTVNRWIDAEMSRLRDG